MNPQVVPTGDAVLFVLDDEGVFFHAPRQELYVFNTAATYLWCCVEGRLALPEIVEAYGEAFGLEPEQAHAQVADVLNQWWSLGYIDDPGVRPASEIPFVTALGRLLANPTLRERFARSLTETIDALGVRGPDRDALLALDPEQLEAEASRIGPRAGSRARVAPGTDTFFSALAGPGLALSEYAAQARLRRLGRPLAAERRYGLLGSTFRLRFDSLEAASRVHVALAHMAAADEGDDDVHLDVVGGDHGYVVLDGALPVSHARTLDELAPKVKALIRQLALDREAFFLELHAGVVSDRESCVLLPGAPGSGKTTLTAGLVFSGFEYFSDEVALLDEDDLRLRPVPLGLGIKPGAVDVLAEHFPGVRELSVHAREDGQRVRYLGLPAERMAPPASRRDARWLVFPRYGPGLETALRPLSRPEALRRLMHECMVLPRLLDEARVEKLVAWMRRLDCYELPMSSLPRAIELVEGLCRSSS